jgi:hypothetical protein
MIAYYESRKSIAHDEDETTNQQHVYVKELPLLEDRRRRDA